MSARNAEDRRVRAEAVEQLEERLTAAVAELRALRAAVVLRDSLLREQQVAIAERDTRIHALLSARLVQPAPPTPFVRRAAYRVLRNVLRATGRPAG